MSDEFSTVSAKRGERAREIETLRQQYRKHREALMAMAAESPSEHLATEYQRLIREIDVAMGKIDELEGRSPGDRPLVPPLVHDEPEYADAPDAGGSGSGSRVALILVAGLVVLALIVFLIWRASSDRPTDEATTTTTTAAVDTAPITTPPPVLEKLLTVSPASASYGTIRFGTRATRQFEVRNNSDEPISIQVERSVCRCLYYEYAAAVPPKGKETITVTVDGARVKQSAPGFETALAETVKVSSKKDPTIATTFEVRTTLR